MKKINKKKASSANSLVSADHSIGEFEIFKSRVANAVLDYMEAQSDLDLLACLEKSCIFLTNISGQMERFLMTKIRLLKIKMICLKSVMTFFTHANKAGQTLFTKTFLYAYSKSPRHSNRYLKVYQKIEKFSSNFTTI